MTAVNLLRCKNCLNAATRPRIEFDSRGWCNACQWMEEKKVLDWGPRQKELIQLLERHKDKGEFDCIVTCSGGKDGSYVAHTLKTRYGINALCLTIRAPMPLELGDQNLISFINSGFEHLHVTPNIESMRTLDRIGFVEYGQGYYGWMLAMKCSVLRIAKTFGISLVFYSEDGEVEYGGSPERKNIASYGIEYIKRAYFSDVYDTVIKMSGLSKKDLYWFEFDSAQFDNSSNFELTHMSYFENWDPYRNYLVAKEFCGLKEYEDGVSGTFTNFAQNDQELASLHYYLMYLKYGFGRATQDAGIEIRRGAMTRDQAVNLVKVYDNKPPRESFEAYAKYYGISMELFLETIDKFANKDLFKKVDGDWQPRFIVS